MQLDMNNSIADDAEIGEERKTVLAKIIIVAKGFVLSGEFLEEKNTAVFSLVEGVSLRTQKGMAQS